MRSDGDGGRSLMPPMRNMNVSFTSESQDNSHDMNTPFSKMSCPANAVCGDVLANQAGLKYFPSYEEETAMNQDDFKYIQCTPSYPRTSKQRNAFKCVMEPMRKFPPRKSFEGAQSSDSDVSNHQTIVCAHENDEDTQSTASSPHKMYRSHTKIESIPHGVRIITEILKQENDGEDYEEACVGRKTRTEGDWLNKKLEVIVEDDDDDDDAEN